jgi:hypothetical protein
MISLQFVILGTKEHSNDSNKMSSALPEETVTGLPARVTQSFTGELGVKRQVGVPWVTDEVFHSISVHFDGSRDLTHYRSTACVEVNAWHNRDN